MIERVLKLLSDATARISLHYFQLPVAGKEDPVYRERVYCYELYHQLRTSLEGERALAGYMLSGEIDKGGHPIIRRCAPDFVFHVPGGMDNLVVVEVKPVNASPEGIQKDVKTLRDFISEPIGYKFAVELVYGDDEAMFRRFQTVFEEARLEHFQLLWHREPGCTCK